MLALDRARRKVNFAVCGGIRGCCHPTPTVGGPESSVFFSGWSSSVSPEDEDFLAGDFLLFGLAVFFFFLVLFWVVGCGSENLAVAGGRY